MRVRMAYCGPRGIPLSTFLNWPVDDQAAALSWQAEDSHRCPGCGTHDWQWEEDWEFAEPEAYVCRGCQRLADARKPFEKNPIPGMYVRLVPTGGRHGAD